MSELNKRNNRRELEITDEISADTMQGDTPLEREINAYLTKQFIWPRDVPTDECLSEAKHIVGLIKDREAVCEERVKRVEAAVDVARAYLDEALSNDLPLSPEGWQRYGLKALRRIEAALDGGGGE